MKMTYFFPVDIQFFFFYKKYMLPVQFFIQVWAVFLSSVRGTSVHPELRKRPQNVSKSPQAPQTTPKASSFI